MSKRSLAFEGDTEASKSFSSGKCVGGAVVSCDCSWLSLQMSREAAWLPPRSLQSVASFWVSQPHLAHSSQHAAVWASSKVSDIARLELVDTRLKVSICAPGACLCLRQSLLS